MASILKLFASNNIICTKKKSLTLGSVSFNYFLKKYNTLHLDLPDKHKKILQSSFCGGRCEVFGNVRQEIEKVLHFDFRGLYQQCMSEKLPYGSFKYTDINLDVNIPGFYYIEIECYSNLPVLPTRDFKLLFQNGKTEGWFWFEEINIALKNMNIQYCRVKAGLICDGFDNYLQAFMEDLGNIKNCDGLKSNIGKSMINSFYGRLAIRDDFEQAVLVGNSEEKGSYIKESSGYCIQNIAIKKKKKSNIGVAAAIASKGRVKLYEGFLEVINSGGRLLYCDTDSIFAAYPKDANVEDRLLGKHVTFRSELNKTADALFIAPKVYALKNLDGSEVVKLRGADPSTIDFNALKKSFYSCDSKSVYITVNKLQAEGLGYRNNPEYRIYLTNYNKRIWIEDKTDSVPIVNK